MATNYENISQVNNKLLDEISSFVSQNTPYKVSKYYDKGFVMISGSTNENLESFEELCVMMKALAKYLMREDWGSKIEICFSKDSNNYNMIVLDKFFYVGNKTRRL